MCDLLLNDALLQVLLLFDPLANRVHTELLELVGISEVISRMEIFDDGLEQVSENFISLFVRCHYTDGRFRSVTATLDAHLYVTSLGCILFLQLTP